MRDKVVVITGASSGIGLALAREFSSKGAKVVLAARRADKLEEIAAQLGKERTYPVATDVTNEQDCKRLMEKTVERFGRIDVLINDAGISMRAILADCETSTLHRVMDVNFWGTVYCTKYALPYLLETKGSVAGILSIAGFIGLPGRTAYSASKFAIRGFLESLRLENRKKGLHVLISAPGFVESEIRKHALLADGSQQKESPRKEKNLMPAEVCAKHIYKAVKKRKRTQVLSIYDGKLAVFMSKWWPTLVDYFNYKEMSSEPNSPF